MLTKICENCSKEFKATRRAAKFCTRSCASLGSKTGGYRKNSGRGIRGWYMGFHFQSTWELAYIIHCVDNAISIARNTKEFEYFSNGKKYNYIPDFTIDDEFVEVKGPIDRKWEDKKKYFPTNLKLNVIDENKITFFLDYAKSKFGKQFWKQFSTLRVGIKKYDKKCLNCSKDFSGPNRQKFCCVTCASRYNKQSDFKFRQIKCERCGSLFRAKKLTTKFCSVKCYRDIKTPG